MVVVVVVVVVVSTRVVGGGSCWCEQNIEIDVTEIKTRINSHF